MVCYSCEREFFPDQVEGKACPFCGCVRRAKTNLFLANDVDLEDPDYRSFAADGYADNFVLEASDALLNQPAPSNDKEDE